MMNDTWNDQTLNEICLRISSIYCLDNILLNPYYEDFSKLSHV